MDKVQHFEIPADDLDRAKKFYQESFGWSLADWPMADGSQYIGISTGPKDSKGMPLEPGYIGGGMFKRGGFFPITSPVVTVVVEDLDASIKKIIDNGGSIVMDKKEVMGAGIYAYVKDTEDNIIGVWQDIKKVQ